MNAPEPAGTLLELRLGASADRSEAFDTWLRDHVADVLQVPGVEQAEILLDAPEGGQAIRRVQYRLADPGVLAAIEAAGAGWPEAGGTGDFDGLLTAERRLLELREHYTRATVSTANCLNCGEVLTGQHCAHCGQRARVPVLSLWALLREVLGDLLDWDARLWRTLRPLAFKPGWLTLEYLQGRRARYTPPFRMYLILSVAFFLAVSLGAGPEFRLSVGGDTAEAPAVSEATAPPPDLQSGQPCDESSLQIDLGPGFEPYVPRLREACRKIVGNSSGFGQAVLDNLPGTMFVFLPLVAAIMHLLYLGSGRFYVEHLLFFVHVHAFFFLGGLVIAVLDGAGALLAGRLAGAVFTSAGDAVSAVQFVYLPYYLYRAMRRVYGQARGITLFKYGLLAGGYAACMVLSGLGLVTYTALSL